MAWAQVGARREHEQRDEALQAQPHEQRDHDEGDVAAAPHRAREVDEQERELREHVDLEAGERAVLRNTERQRHQREEQERDRGCAPPRAPVARIAADEQPRRPGQVEPDDRDGRDGERPTAEGTEGGDVVAIARVDVELQRDVDDDEGQQQAADAAEQRRGRRQRQGGRREADHERARRRRSPGDGSRHGPRDEHEDDLCPARQPRATGETAQRGDPRDGLRRVHRPAAISVVPDTATVRVTASTTASTCSRVSSGYIGSERTRRRSAP